MLERNVEVASQDRREHLLDRSGPRVGVGVGHRQPGDCGEDAFARTRLALEATPAAT